MKGGGIKYTDNKNIARDTNNENILYVKQDYLPKLKEQNPFIYQYLQKTGTRKLDDNTALNLKDQTVIEMPHNPRVYQKEY